LALQRIEGVGDIMAKNSHALWFIEGFYYKGLQLAAIDGIGSVLFKR
jgi:hypothetical protein